MLLGEAARVPPRVGPEASLRWAAPLVQLWGRRAEGQEAQLGIRGPGRPGSRSRRKAPQAPGASGRFPRPWAGSPRLLAKGTLKIRAVGQQLPTLEVTSSSCKLGNWKHGP